MNYSDSLKSLFGAITMLVIGSICFIRMGGVNVHTIMATGMVMVPAIIIIGLLGGKIGEILDSPQNRTDADYKIAVLNALKKLDKSMTLQDLNEKLNKTVAEPDAPDSDVEDVDI